MSRIAWLGAPEVRLEACSRRKATSTVSVLTEKGAMHLAALGDEEELSGEVR